ncbi:MAG TPA: hypothetical protein VF669_03480 [Tepidisphaeraceae bacterium]|jgi:hypothetical protein
MSKRSLSFCAFAMLLILNLPSLLRAEDHPTTAPANVTLKLDGVPPQQALDEFSSKTGVALKVWPETLLTENRKSYSIPETVSLDVQDKTFWEAFGELCAALHLQPTNMGSNEEAITLQSHGSSAKGPFAGPQSVSPSATVVVTSIQRNHTISFDRENPEPSTACGINIVAYVDPRLRPMKYNSRPSLDKAEDENGKSLIKESSENSSPNMNDMYVRWQVQHTFIPLDYQPNESHKLANLKGSIALQVAAEVETLEIPDIDQAQGTEKELAGRKVIIDEVKDENNQFSVKFTIKRQDVSKEEFRKTSNSIFRTVKLRTADNKALSSGGGGGGGDDSLTYTYSTSYKSDEDKPAKLVWELPTRIEDIELPFEFKDLTLP